MGLADVLRGAYVKKAPTGSIDLVGLINSKLGGRKLQQPHSADSVLRVSTVIKMCPRQEVLRYRLGIPKAEAITPTLQATFDFGNAFHELVQNRWFGQWGILIGDWRCLNCGTVVRNRKIPPHCFLCKGSKFHYEELTPINDKHGISGHVDGVIEVGDYRGVLELKTYNGKAYSYVAMYDKPMPGHLDQIQMYMWLTKERSGVILYFDKEESKMKNYSVSYQPEVVELFLGRVGQFRHAMRTETLPKRELCGTKDCTRARACTVRKDCFSRD